MLMGRRGRGSRGLGMRLVGYAIRIVQRWKGGIKYPLYDVRPYVISPTTYQSTDQVSTLSSPPIDQPMTQALRAVRPILKNTL